MSTIIIYKTVERYILTKHVESAIADVIVAEIHVDIEDGKLTISTDNDWGKFEFRKSEPNMVKDIAELMLEAVKLINKKEK